MKYVIAENYLCFLSLLEMIIEDATGLKITQQDLAEEFGIIVPHGYNIGINNIKFSSVENDYGVKISEEKLQEFFDEKEIGLRIKYLDGTRINELDLNVRFARYLKEKNMLF